MPSVASSGSSTAAVVVPESTPRGRPERINALKTILPDMIITLLMSVQSRLISQLDKDQLPPQFPQCHGYHTSLDDSSLAPKVTMAATVPGDFMVSMAPAASVAVNPALHFSIIVTTCSSTGTAHFSIIVTTCSGTGTAPPASDMASHIATHTAWISMTSSLWISHRTPDIHCGAATYLTRYGCD